MTRTGKFALAATGLACAAATAAPTAALAQPNSPHRAPVSAPDNGWRKSPHVIQLCDLKLKNKWGAYVQVQFANKTSKFYHHLGYPCADFLAPNRGGSIRFRVNTKHYNGTTIRRWGPWTGWARY
jgi:hypothetical protein